MQQATSQLQPTAGDLVSFDQWIRSLNRTRATGHRWRRQFPWLETTNIFGKLYIRRKTIKSLSGALSPENLKKIFIRWPRFYRNQAACARQKPATAQFKLRI
jgi:hypothetical protein